MVTSSIVLYKTSHLEAERTIKCVLSSNIQFLYLIDNSPSDDLRQVSSDQRIVYIHNPSNPGFGASHNIAIWDAIARDAKYHFVINPDVSFTTGVIEKMVSYMDSHDHVAMIMPQVLNEDDTIQHLPKLLPSPLSIIQRILNRRYGWFKRFIIDYELRMVPNHTIYSAPIISGCFTLFRLDALRKVGVYDDKFFMYFEDWDLSRRMHVYYDTIYYPEVSIYHGYESGANKSMKLFKIFVRSAIYYFSKWGWIFDGKRRLINKKTIQQFK
ncbi:glycosyltransferase [Sphingobacterium spiritivorum]|uniref:glycosyltransferase n=1 Tax=Sphingobacterium spiritivorum TaxID=258 RepID=UPI00191A897D|nr:glycosyltransferase family 2 protein [Sphingobacterium spiritivorum]QQT27814.1 glycosyltransferase family 2 protein [Sphingobacterium spiritivorum]